MVDLVAKVGSAVLPTRESFICIEVEHARGDAAAPRLGPGCSLCLFCVLVEKGQ